VAFASVARRAGAVAAHDGARLCVERLPLVDNATRAALIDCGVEIRRRLRGRVIHLLLRLREGHGVLVRGLLRLREGREIRVCVRGPHPPVVIGARVAAARDSLELNPGAQPVARGAI